jgi:hypothetical protein
MLTSSSTSLMSDEYTYIGCADTVRKSCGEIDVKFSLSHCPKFTCLAKINAHTSMVRVHTFIPNTSYCKQPFKGTPKQNHATQKRNR